MGKRTIEIEGKKINWLKVVITILVLILLIIAAIKGIESLIKNTDKIEKEANIEIPQEEEVIKESKKTIEEILQDFGGEVKQQVKDDTYYVIKDGKNYTVYLDGEITEDEIIPWDGKEAKPAIDEAGNINIYSAAELAWIANQVISGEKNFSGVTISLRKNIDLGAREKEDGSWEGIDWKPIVGFLDEIPEKKNSNSQAEDEVVTDENIDIKKENLKRFDGVFDGCGHSIRGMKVDSDKKYQGLFGYLSGTVSNLTIKNSSVKGKEAIGAMVGLNAGRVVNCNVENTLVTGKEKIGGLVGIAMTESIIENSTVRENCKVTGENNIGGLIGYTNNNVSIRNCTNDSIVEGKEYVGGITGISFYGTTIQSCTNYSSKIEGENYVGGLVGYSAAQIEKCNNQMLSENSGKIIGKKYVGGIAGLNYLMGDINESFNNGQIIVLEDNGGGIVGINNSSISNCYNKGIVDCTKASGLRIGGICGQNLLESFINTSYNIGKIKNNTYAGGVVGADFGNVSDSFCLDSCLEKQNADVEYNKTEAEFKSTIIQNLGASFKNDENSINSGYPILNWQ